MENKIIIIGKDKWPVEMIKNFKNDTIKFKGFDLKKELLLSVDRIYSPISYHLNNFINKELDGIYTKGQPNKHYCEVKNPYVQDKINILKNERYIPFTATSYSVMLVMKNNKYGLIDGKCNFLLPIEYDQITSTNRYNYPYLIVKKNNESWVFNVLQFERISKIYDKIEYSREGYLKVYKNGQCGLIEEQGSEIIPTIYDDCSGSVWFHYNDKKHKYIIITKNNKKGIINEEGETIAEVKYDKIQIYYHTDGYHNNLEATGWIDDEKFTLIDPEYQGRKYISRHSSYESPTFERYSGSYAQDEMGYSDDDIDTIFEGDPSAYWNID